MKPVTPSQFDSTAEAKKILILNMTRLSIQFVSFLVNKSPGNITTKQGDKRLPLELWREILTLAETDSKCGNYWLVQAQSMEEHGTQRTLVCAEITEWNKCGLLQDWIAVYEYQLYLDYPGKGPEPRRPFVLPEAGDQDSTVKVNESLLSPENEVLFSDLSPCHVLAWVEHGDCCLCEKDRRVLVHQDHVESGLFGIDIAHTMMDQYVSCPLCLHLGIVVELLGSEYDQLIRERCEELGYEGYLLPSF